MELLMNNDSSRNIYSIDVGTLTKEEAEKAIKKAMKKKKLNEGDGGSPGPQLLNE